MTKTQGSVPEPAAPVKPPTVCAPVPPNSSSAQDVNEQFLGLLDTDTAAKFKELEEKCELMREQQAKLEEELKQEAEKNLTLVKDAEQVEAKLLKIQELEKENVLLQEKLDVAAKEDMNLFVLEDVPVIVSSAESEKIDDQKDVKVVQGDEVDVESIKGEEMVKAAEEEKMLEEKDKAADEAKKSLEDRDTELQQLRESLAELTSRSSFKEGQLLGEIESLKARLGAKYSFLECGVNVKKVDPEKVINVKVQDLVEAMVDQVTSSENVEKDLANEEEEGNISKKEVKENDLLRAENDRIKSEMATMEKAMGNFKAFEGGSVVGKSSTEIKEIEKAEMEAKEMNWKRVLAETTLKVETLSKEKEERERKMQEQTEELKKVLENELELKQTITIINRVKESAHQEKELLKKELEDLKEKSPNINAEAESMELLKAELEELKKEKSKKAYLIADKVATSEKDGSLLSLKRKRSLSGEEVKKSKLERVEEEEVAREISEVPEELLTVTKDLSVVKDLSEMSACIQNIPTLTQLEKEKAELEQELRMKEMSGKEAFCEEEATLPLKEKSVKEAISKEVRAKAISEEEALLASPQPAAKPANILFCNWADPDEEVR